MAIDRKKTSLYLDVRLVKAAKVMAVQSGKRDYQIFEDALRQYVDSRRAEAGRDLRRLLREVADRQEREGVPPLTDDEAMALAIEEIKAHRAEQRQAQQT